MRLVRTTATRPAAHAGAVGHDGIIRATLIAASLLFAGALQAGDLPPATGFVADPAVQADLAALAVLPAGAERDAVRAGLRDASREDRARLVRELVWFQSRATGDRSSALAGSMLKELDVAEPDVVAAVVPLLESEDALLLKQAGNILGGYENESAERAPDYSSYRAMIASARRNGIPLPRGLIGYMYESSPGTALLSMVRAMGVRDPDALKEIRWSEHVVADLLWRWRYGFLARDVVDPAVRTQLDRLSRHAAWWVRLYVPAVMKQHAALRDQDVLERLKSDEDPLVARFARRVSRDAVGVQP